MRKRRRKKKSWNRNCAIIERYYQPPFLFAQGTGGRRSRSHRRRTVGQWVAGFRRRNAEAISHGETWPFSDSWLRPKSSKPICGNNTTNWEASRTAKSQGEVGVHLRHGPSVLDADMSQYIHDNTEDEFSHLTFINAYLASKGADPVNLDKFRTLPSSKATGAQQIGRLTNLMQLTVDTSWWTRYRSRTKNPDFGGTFRSAIPGSECGQISGDSQTRWRPRPHRPHPGDRQHGGLPLWVYRARWHQPLPIAGSESHQSGSVAHLAQYRPNRDIAHFRPGMTRRAMRLL